MTPNSDGTWTESLLHRFAGSTDGHSPAAGLIFDASGNLYGTTVLGNVFKLTPNSDGSWTEHTLYNFSNGDDGGAPRGGVIFDAAGNLYGTGSNFGANGFGVVFKLTPNSNGTWTESVLYPFTGGSDGHFPEASLIFDSTGNLYGTTAAGGDFGACPSGCGVVFKLSPNSDGTWTESVIHSFNSGDGNTPTAGLIFDSAGNLYGTTNAGGVVGFGVVFKLKPDSDGTWTERILHSFANHPAAFPFASLIFDAAGNLYGTTVNSSPVDGGTVFKMTPNLNGSWAFSVLHLFHGNPALHQFGGLVRDKSGNLYGTTADCGSGTGSQGVVYEVTP